MMMDRGKNSINSFVSYPGNFSKVIKKLYIKKYLSHIMDPEEIDKKFHKELKIEFMPLQQIE